jgi:mannosyltransferase OCH1-like enzyme
LIAPKVRDKLAVIYAVQQRFAEAEALWKVALIEDPKCLQARAGLGDIYLETQRWADVATNAHVMSRLGPLGAEEAAVQVGRMRMRQDLFEAAYIHLSASLRRLPNSRRIKELLAETMQIRQWRSKSALLFADPPANVGREGVMPEIPRVLHQVWLGRTPISPLVRDWQQKLQELHPAWEYRLWTEDTIRDLPIAELLPLCRSLSSASNVVRLAVIAMYGGVYLDCDCEPIRPLDDLLGHGAFAALEQENSLCNAVFGAVPNHAWVRWQINNLPQYVSRAPPWGPMLMSAAPRDELTIVPTRCFYPFLWNAPEAMREASPESYVLHHWNLSWQSRHNV